MRNRPIMLPRSERQLRQSAFLSVPILSGGNHFKRVQVNFNIILVTEYCEMVCRCAGIRQWYSCSCQQHLHCLLHPFLARSQLFHKLVLVGGDFSQTLDDFLHSGLLQRESSCFCERGQQVLATISDKIRMIDFSDTNSHWQIPRECFIVTIAGMNKERKVNTSLRACSVQSLRGKGESR